LFVDLAVVLVVLDELNDEGSVGESEDLGVLKSRKREIGQAQDEKVAKGEERERTILSLVFQRSSCSKKQKRGQLLRSRQR